MRNMKKENDLREKNKFSLLSSKKHTEQLTELSE
jgi:hypothetical protein